MISLTALRTVVTELRLGGNQVIGASDANAVKHVLAAGKDGLLHRVPTDRLPPSVPPVDPRVLARARDSSGRVLAWVPTGKGEAAFQAVRRSVVKYAGNFPPLTAEGKKEVRRRDAELLAEVSAAVAEWERKPEPALFAGLSPHAIAALRRMLATPPDGMTVADVEAFIAENASQLAAMRPARKASVTFPKDVLAALESLETAEIEAAIQRVNRLGDQQCKLPDVELANLNVKACDTLRDRLVAWRDSPVRAMLVRERRREDSNVLMFGKSSVTHRKNYRED